MIRSSGTMMSETEEIRAEISFKIVDRAEELCLEHDKTAAPICYHCAIRAALQWAAEIAGKYEDEGWPATEIAAEIRKGIR